MKSEIRMKITVDSITQSMIAPCGMNCCLCISHLREKKKCLGCNESDVNKPQSCITCIIKNCEELTKSDEPFCYTCLKYPCKRLKNLDKRYRSKYGMSMLKNLTNIKESGIDTFLENEKKRWKCSECGYIISVHRKNCIYCGLERK